METKNARELPRAFFVFKDICYEIILAGKQNSKGVVL